MPISVDDLARMGVGQPVKDKPIEAPKSTPIKGEITAKSLAVIGSGIPVKKNDGLEKDSTNTVHVDVPAKLPSPEEKKRKPFWEQAAIDDKQVYFNIKLDNGDLTANDIQDYKRFNPTEYNALAKEYFPSSGDAFLKSDTAAQMLSTSLNAKSKETNFINAKNYDATYFKELDNKIKETAAPINKFFEKVGIPVKIEPTNDVDKSRGQLKSLTDATRLNIEAINRDKMVSYEEDVVAGNKFKVKEKGQYDVTAMSDEEIDRKRTTDPDLYNRLLEAKRKVNLGREIDEKLHNAINPIQSKFGDNLVRQVKSNNLPDPNEDGNDAVRHIGEQIYKIKDPDHFALYQKAGGYDAKKTYSEQSFDSDLDKVNKDIMSLGYAALKGDVAANGTDSQYANIYENLKYLDYKFATPKAEETKHRVAAALKAKGINPTTASDEEKDEIVRSLPLENQEVWFNKMKVNNQTSLPNTGFWYSTANATKNTWSNAARSGSVLSPTAWATLFLGTESDKENAQEILRDEMKSNVLGENPESRQRYNELQARKKDKTITPQELNELNDLAQFTDKRTSWDKFKDGNGNMVGMIAGVTADALPTLGAGLISKSVVGGTQALVAEQAAAKGIADVPLLENTIANTTKSFAERIGIPRDAESIVNFAKNKNEMFVIMHHDNAKRAMELFPDNDTKKAWYTGITDVLSMAMPNLLPTHKLGELFNKETKNVVSELVGKLSETNLDNAVIENLMKETAKKIFAKAGTFVVGTEKAAAEASLTMALMNLGNNVTQAILKPDSISGGDIANGFIQTISSTFLDSQLVGLIGGKSAVQKKFGQLGVDAIYDATQSENSANAVKYNILKQQSKSELTEQQANEKISILNIASEVRPAVDNLQMEENLTPSESKRVFVNLLNERIIKGKIKKLKETDASESLILPLEKRIKEINDINNKIIGKEIVVHDDYSISEKNNIPKNIDTKLSQPIEGLDDQGVPIGDNVVEPSSVSSEVGGDKTGLVLYHGSPHSFENFDITKLGSGEGQQVFGHGLYFTNEADIAKGYANKLGSKKNFWEALQSGHELSLSKDDYNFVKKELDALGFDGEKAENADLGNILVEGKSEYAPDVLDAMSVLFGKDAKKELEGYDLSGSEITRLLEIKKKISDPQFYKVALHEGKLPSEYDYIEWREKLSDSQRKKIGFELPENVNGEEAYKAISEKLGGDKKASDYLLSKGVDGITYKSEKGTGGKTGEGRNYVVFDPKSIRIDEINQQKQTFQSKEQENKPLTSDKKGDNVVEDNSSLKDEKGLTIGSNEWDKSNPLHQKITDVLRANGFEVENESSNKSFSEYIKVPIRDDKGNVDYRLKIRVSDHSLPRGGSLANADIRTNKTIAEAVDIIKNSREEFKNLKIPEQFLSKEQPSNKKGDNVPEAVSIEDTRPDIKNYDGIFSTTTSTKMNYETGVKADIKNGDGWRVELMTPDEYLNLIESEIKNRLAYAQKKSHNEIDYNSNLNNSSREAIKKAVDKGEKIDMPFIEFGEDTHGRKGTMIEQDGRNRAAYAKEKGERYIPVMVKGERIKTEETEPNNIHQPTEDNVGNKNEIDNYNGIFSKETTGMPDVDRVLKGEVKGRKAVIEMMSPDEYLKRVREGFGEENDENITKYSIKDIKKGIDNGDKINMPYLRYAKGGEFDGQEGRNRAVVAKESGEKLIPVVVDRELSTEESKGVKDTKEGNITKQSKTENDGNDQKGSKESNGKESRQSSSEEGSKKGSRKESDEGNDVDKKDATESEDNAASLLGRVKEKKVINYENPSLEEVKEQALQAPNSLSNALKDEALVIDLIADNKKEDIEKAIKYQQGRLAENATEKDITDIDNHIQLLEKGLEKHNELNTKEPVSLKHADTEAARKDKGLPDREEKERKTDKQLLEDADKEIKNGFDVDKLVNDIIDNKRRATDTEQIILVKYATELNTKLESLEVGTKDFQDQLAAVEKVYKASEMSGSNLGSDLRARKLGVLSNETLSGYFIQEKELNKNAPLTKNQEKEVKKEYDDITEAEKVYQQRIDALEAENAKLLADKQIKKQTAIPKKQNKTSEDFKAERQSFKDKLKEQVEDYKKSINKLGIKSDGGVESFIISAKMAKTVGDIVKSYVEQGATKLSEITEKVFGEVKDILKGITEKDIHDVIAGKYADKKPERTKVAATLVDLKEEAKLIDKLNALLSGKEPIKERKKIKRNQEIETLRQKIKDFKDSQKTPEKSELNAYKDRLNKRIIEVEKQLKEGNFEKPIPKKEIVLDKETLEAKDKLIKLKQDRQYRILKKQYENQSKYEKGVRNLSQVLNIPRSLMSTLDYSALLRQAVIPVISNPRMGAKAAAEMFKSSFSQKNYDRWIYDLQKSPRYELMKDSRLAITDSVSPDLQAREEVFMTNIVDRVPVLGQLTKGSERAYSQLLNKMRVDLFNRFADSMEARGLTFKNSPEQYKQMAAYVNNSTGRGDLGTTLNKAAPLLNALFFSPRLIASRLNMLTYLAQPRFYRTVPKEVRAAYFKDMSIFIGAGLAVLALAKLNGAQVEDDPRSADFGKIKSGNTRWDIWGGFQQYIKGATQIITGESKSSNTGDIHKLDGEGMFGRDKGDVIMNMGRGKLAPVPSMIWDLIKGRNIVGDKISLTQWGSETDWKDEKTIGLGEYLGTHFLPLTSTGLADAMEDQGIKSLFTVGIPSLLGVGTQTYGNE